MSKLGTVADFTDLLDTLVKLDSGERESNERMAMAHLREDREDRRQDKRIEEQKDFSIDLENRKIIGPAIILP